MTYRLAIAIGLILGIALGWAALAINEQPTRNQPLIIGVRHA